MHNSVTVRDASVDDAPEVARLLAVLGYEWPVDDVAARLPAFLDSPRLLRTARLYCNQFPLWQSAAVTVTAAAPSARTARTRGQANGQIQ
jgi:hypothetical protein